MLMGVREYGRHRGVSHVAVLKALRSGRIRQDPDGQINAEQADRDWARNTHPALRAPRAVPSAAQAGYSQARTVRAHFEALLVKREYEEKAASLVSADEVKIVSARIGADLRDNMLQVPDAVVGKLRSYIREHGTGPNEHVVHSILAAEIRAALQTFADDLGSRHLADGTASAE